MYNLHFLHIILILSLLGIGCISAPTTSTDDLSENFIEIKKEVLRHSNIYRKSQKRGTLQVKSELNKIAQRHSDNMAAGRVAFSHDGFQGRFNSVKKYANFPVSVAENLYATYDPKEVGKSSVLAWIDSPGHKKNLRGNFIYSGIGVSKSSSGEYFVVQLYVGKSKNQ